VLVNNAGLGIYTKFGAEGRDKELQMLRVDVEAVADLMLRYLPGMVDRGRGAIINLSSVSGFQPAPYNAGYAAAKAYVLWLSEAVNAEVAGPGVTVTAGGRRRAESRRPWSRLGGAGGTAGEIGAGVLPVRAHSVGVAGPFPHVEALTARVGFDGSARRRGNRWSTLGFMTDPGAGRVAVYLDFDNIVISRYDQVHGRSSFQRDKAKGLDKHPDKLARATVDVGAVIDFASSFGTLVLTRAYADWANEVNTGYREQLVGRAVDLVQLFPAAAYGKNGADIRLAVDAVEDMFRLPDLTHVVIVAGDSDYIPLAQRCKRLGRYVVGVGVAGSSSRALAAACDEFVTYDTLPGVPVAKPEAAPGGTTTPKKRTTRAKAADADEPPPPDPQAAATDLLTRALRMGLEKDDVDWLHNSAVKAQMKRMDPSFSERSLGFKSFSGFLRSRSDLVELDESSTTRMVRLRGDA
jgi:hypothetical protein